jgi:hypothetical protein
MFRQSLKQLIFSLIFLGFAVIGTNSCLAINSQAANQMDSQSSALLGTSSLSPKTADLSGIIATILTLVLSILGVLFLILTIIAGFKWMTAGGNEETIKKQTTNIKNSLFGLIVIVAAYSITYFIFYSLPLGFNQGGASSGVSTISTNP